MSASGPINPKRKLLRIGGRAVVLVSVAVQILFVTGAWWHFDPRLTCDRLPYWGEWLTCMHGMSHLHIVVAEFAIGTWLLAGLALLLGRYLPPYISIVVPGCVAA